MKKIKKIAMVTPFPREHGVIKGGVEGVANNLVRGLKKTGDYDIHVISPTSNKKCYFENRNGINIHWISTPRVPGFLKYWTIERAKMIKKMEEINPDIAHFQGVLGWSIGYKKPFVSTIHGISERDVLYSSQRFKSIRSKVVEAVEYYARRKSKKIISISPYVRNEIRSHLINSQVIDVENPVENEFFEIKRAPDKNRLLYVGRINERKNIKTLIEAFALLSRRNIDAKLTIAGDYDDKCYFQECEKIVDDLGLNDSVEFIGGIDRGRLVEELKTTSCLILVSLQETAPMIVEEAMSAGVPVVASNICGLPYMVEDGISGYLVNAKDKNDIAEKIESIVLDKERNIAMGERAREIAKDRFHYLSVARKTIAVYENSL